MEEKRRSHAKQVLHFSTTADLIPGPLFSADRHTIYQFYLTKEAVCYCRITHPDTEIDSKEDPTWSAILRFMRFYRPLPSYTGFEC